jgi:ribose transport system permease protein
MKLQKATGAQMAQAGAATLSKGPRFTISKGLMTVLVSTIVLFVLCAVIAPSSVSSGPLGSMIPFASILAIAGLGQMALGVAILVGILNGFLIGFLKLNPIIATLGTNALLFGFIMAITGGIPSSSAPLLLAVVSGLTFGIPNAAYFAGAILLLVVLALRKTVAGRRFESIGSSPAMASISGLRVRLHQGMAYVWAQLLYAVAGIMIAGIITVSNAFMGDPYLLPSVAVVVLGGTSLLGGRGLPTATVIAAVFLSQLDQFVLALGVNFAIRTLVQAAALAIGVAIYTVDWARVRAALNRLLSTTSRGQNQTSLPSA